MSCRSVSYKGLPRGRHQHRSAQTILACCEKNYYIHRTFPGRRIFTKLAPAFAVSVRVAAVNAIWSPRVYVTSLCGASVNVTMPSIFVVGFLLKTIVIAVAGFFGEDVVDDQDVRGLSRVRQFSLGKKILPLLIRIFLGIDELIRIL